MWPSPRQPIPDNFLWIVELMPGIAVPQDVSWTLRDRGYWGIYFIIQCVIVFDSDEHFLLATSIIQQSV
jgi:hypothetical protein